MEFITFTLFLFVYGLTIIIGACAVHCLCMFERTRHLPRVFPFCLSPSDQRNNLINHVVLPNHCSNLLCSPSDSLRLNWCVSIFAVVSLTHSQVPSGLPRNLESALQRYAGLSCKTPVMTCLDVCGRPTQVLTYAKLLQVSWMHGF